MFIKLFEIYIFTRIRQMFILKFKVIQSYYLSLTLYYYDIRYFIYVHGEIKRTQPFEFEETCILMMNEMK